MSANTAAASNVKLAAASRSTPLASVSGFMRSPPTTFVLDEDMQGQRLASKYCGLHQHAATTPFDEVLITKGFQRASVRCH